MLVVLTTCPYFGYVQYVTENVPEYDSLKRVGTLTKVFT